MHGVFAVFDADMVSPASSQYLTTHILACPLEKHDIKAAKSDEGAVTEAVDLAKKKNIREGKNWKLSGDGHCSFFLPKSCTGSYAGFCSIKRRVQFDGCVADPVQTISAILPGSQRSVLLLRLVVQEAMNEVLNVNPRLKMKVHVGAIKIHVWGKHREFSREITMEVSEKLIEGVAKEG